MTTSERIRTRRGLSLVTAGEGPPLIFLHGIGGAAESGQAVAELLARRGRHTLCWDAPGYGESADPSAEVDHVKEVIALLDELGLPSAALFGTSWGGVIATRVALDHPDRVTTLVLADSTRGSAVSADRAAGMRARVDELRDLGAHEFARRRAPNLVSPQADPDIAETVRATMARVRVPGYAAAAEFMATSDTGPRLSDIACPTLVVVGEHDTITGVQESRLLAERIPGAEFALIPRAGHAAVTERPAAVADSIEAFMEDR